MSESKSHSGKNGENRKMMMKIMILAAVIIIGIAVGYAITVGLARGV